MNPAAACHRGCGVYWWAHQRVQVDPNLAIALRRKDTCMGSARYFKTGIVWWEEGSVDKHASSSIPFDRPLPEALHADKPLAWLATSVLDQCPRSCQPSQRLICMTCLW